MRTVAKIRQRGDTIVEVLIAIAVISMVLAGAYATTNRSLLATRAAQERSNALKLVETQLEQIKGMSVADPDTLFGNVPGSFCVTPALAIASSNDNACRVDAAGQPNDVEPIYNLSVTRSGPDGQGGYVFTVTSEWVDPSGRHDNQVRTIYRVYR
jgi:prepilin-type N-terminal cleavage/methylation domain-containing protein